MVKALHHAGIELVIELYFDGSEAPGYVLDVVRFWAMEYHVDGVHLVGFAHPAGRRSLFKRSEAVGRRLERGRFPPHL